MRPILQHAAATRGGDGGGCVDARDYLVADGHAASPWWVTTCRQHRRQRSRCRAGGRLVKYCSQVLAYPGGQVTGRAMLSRASRQADLAHHLEQAIGVGFEKPLELWPVHVGDLAARFHEALDHGLVLHERTDRVAQNVRHVRGRFSRREHAGSEDVDHIRISRLLQRRRVRKARQPLGAPLRQHANVAGIELALADRLERGTTGTWSERSALNAGPPPWYGTWIILSCAALRNVCKPPAISSKEKD